MKKKKAAIDNETQISEPEAKQTEQVGDYKIKKTNGLDITAKILAVLLALIIWLYAVSSDSPVFEDTFDSISISIINIPSGLSVITGDKSLVDVTVKGKRTDVRSLKSSSIYVYVDASGVSQAGEYTLPLSVKLPDGISLVSPTNPEAVTVYFDVTSSKQLPITVVPKNCPIPDGYTLKSTVLSGSDVTVRGPSGELAKIAKVEAVVEPGAVTSSVSITSSLTLYDEDGNEYTNPYVTLSVSEVTVRLELYTSKEVPLKVAYKYGYYNDSNVKITLSPAAITVEGTAETLDKLDSITVTTIDETSILSDVSIVAPIDVPDGVTYTGAENATITIKHVSTVTRVIVCNSIQLINVPDGKSVTVNTESINVTLRGDDNEYFRYFEASDITVTVDLAGYDNISGDITASAVIAIANDSTETVIYALGTYSVSVTLS